MNARTVRKILMRGRPHSSFGQPHATLTVRLPAYLYPPPTVRMPTFEGLLPYGSGLWSSPDHEEKVMIGLFETSDPPLEEEKPLAHGLTRDPVFESWSWWEGYRVNVRDDKGRQPLDKNTVLAYAEWHLWRDGITDRGRHPILDSFLDAKTNWWGLTLDAKGDWIYLTYLLDWKQADAKATFCARLARAVRHAKQTGVGVRVIGRPLYGHG